MRKSLAFLVATTLASGAYSQDNRCVESGDFTPMDPCQIPECSDEMQECQKQPVQKEEPRNLCTLFNEIICKVA